MGVILLRVGGYGMRKFFSPGFTATSLALITALTGCGSSSDVEVTPGPDSGADAHDAGRDVAHVDVSHDVSVEGSSDSSSDVSVDVVAEGGSCPTVAFVQPLDGATLTEADDADPRGPDG